MPSSRDYGCCSVRQPFEERERILSSPVAQDERQRRLHSAWSLEAGGSKLPPQSLWKDWLSDWEGRQMENLRRHEEATKELVSSLRMDLMAKLEPLEKIDRLEAARRTQRVTAMADSKTKDGAGAQSLYSLSPNITYVDMNSAVADVVGGARYHAAEQRMKQKTRSQSTRMSEVMFYTVSTDPDEGPRYTPRNRAQERLFHIVHHPIFSTLSATMVGIYAIAVGVLADEEMRAAVNALEPPRWRTYVDMSFTFLFVLEVLLRLVAEGGFFFRGGDRNWNIFDMAISAVGVLDLASAEGMNLSFLRIIRTFRAMRLLRVIRIFKVFKELRLMMASILCCLVPLTWAFALLVAVIYVFAVVLLQGASEFLQKSPCTEPFCDVLTGSFGGMWLTIYSLTQAISGGRSWGEFSDPFLEISVWYGFFFALFVIFVMFGILNILTGVFVEGTATIANVDKELVIQEEMSRTESAVGQIRKLFREIDENGSGTITCSELLTKLKDERVRAHFSLLQIDVSEAHGLFRLLDKDNSGEVSIDEFIVNCMRLKGTARSVDLAAVLFESKRFYTAMKAFMGNVETSFKGIDEKLGVITHYTEASLL